MRVAAAAVNMATSANDVSVVSDVSDVNVVIAGRMGSTERPEADKDVVSTTTDESTKPVSLPEEEEERSCVICHGSCTQQCARIVAYQIDSKLVGRY